MEQNRKLVSDSSYPKIDFVSSNFKSLTQHLVDNVKGLATNPPSARVSAIKNVKSRIDTGISGDPVLKKI